MADVQSIHPADLRKIENSLSAINGNINELNQDINRVDNNVRIVYDEVGQLAKEFKEYVEIAERQHNIEVAQTCLIKVRQELEGKYGHYAQVRRTTTGILQADDLGIVRRETISTATEELMLSTPGYWLAPCLVALSAWISDQPELADRALRESIKRNDEKTSLFFALICRRAGRKSSCLKWTQRYLENQDAEQLDRKCVIILDAFASGLLGADSEGLVSCKIEEWIDHLSEKPGFIEQQRNQWSSAINLQRIAFQGSDYAYLKKYSKTWPVLSEIMEGARLHATILEYFKKIFDQEDTTDTLKEQLDSILTSLVTDYDDEELPLRKEEKRNQFIVDFDGDLTRANANMTVEESAFEETKDFTQLLTDSAMKPESSHASVSTQKFSIALSRDWIVDAYNDLTAANRMKIPNEIQINIENFDDKTTDGTNEEELIKKFQDMVETEKNNALMKCVLSGFDQFLLYGGAAITGVALMMIIFGNIFLGIIAAIAGIGMIMNHFSKKKKMDINRQNIVRQCDEKRDKGTQLIRAVLAEVVDFRAEFEEKDAESEKVLDFLSQLTPEQYIRKIAETTRRVKTMG